jgi:serine/threonine protein kinase/regulation of enolase protein 1 (concanavalin A-like superfamily)
MLSGDTCPTPREIRQVLLGRLPEARLEILETHLEGCAHCQQVLDRLEVEGPLGRVLKEQSPDGACSDGELGEEVGELVEQLERLGTPWSLGSSGSASSAAGPADVNEFPFLAPAQAADELGRLVQYRVLELLGTGGMGLVFRAQDTHLQRLVALKVLRPRYARKPEARERFLREARAMAAVKHDNITTIFQVGEVAAPSPSPLPHPGGEGRVRGTEPVPFLAMELLEGESLADWLRRHGRPPSALVARLGRQMAAGLAAAHAHGLIHRDIKPANLWLEAPPGWADEPPPARRALAAVGRVKLLDFGLATPLDDGGREGVSAGAPEREVMGTPAYMAPEQIRGEPLDGRCDLFALGCVLYELCAGAPPFRRDRRQLRARALDDPPLRSLTEANPAVPAALAELIGQLLAPIPSERPASARRVEQQLAAIERAAGTADTLSDCHPPTEDLTPTGPQRVRRRWWLPATAAGAVLGLAASLLLFFWPRGGLPTTVPVLADSGPPLAISASPPSAVRPDLPVVGPEPPPANPVLADWVSQDIGSVGQRGFSHYNHETGAFTVAGSGADVWGTADGFRYTYQQLTGDGVIQARVTQMQNTHFFAKVGVMMRETLAAGSKHVSMVATSRLGPQFLWRRTAGGRSDQKSPYHRKRFAPLWVRLERRGDMFSGSFSSDGVTWTQLSSATVPMTGTVYVGLISCALNNSRTNVGILDDVSVLPVGWSARSVGAVDRPGFSHFDPATGAFTVAGSGADVWGTADGFRYTYQQLTGDGVIQAQVTQMQNTHVWAKVGVMMRETLTAGSKHVSMVATSRQGPEFLWRSATGGNGGQTAPYQGRPFAPWWVRLERQGDTFRGSFSPDGLTWTQLGATTIAMTATVHVGLASSAHNNARINVGILDHVAVLDAAALRRLSAPAP